MRLLDSFAVQVLLLIAWVYVASIPMAWLINRYLGKLLYRVQEYLKRRLYTRKLK